MALSELALTPAEVDIIMADIAGQSSAAAAAAAVAPVTVLQPRTGQESVQPGASSLQPPQPAGSSVNVTSSGPPLLARPPAPVKLSETKGPALLALGAAAGGFLVGGPVGAVVTGLSAYFLARNAK